MTLHRRLERLERDIPPEEPPGIDWEALALPIELRVARELSVEALAPVERYRAVKQYLEAHQHLIPGDARKDVLAVSRWRGVRCRQLGLNAHTEFWYWRHNDEGILVDRDPLEARRSYARNWCTELSLEAGGVPC